MRLGDHSHSDRADRASRSAGPILLSYAGKGPGVIATAAAVLAPLLYGLGWLWLCGYLTFALILDRLGIDSWDVVARWVAQDAPAVLWMASGVVALAMLVIPQYRARNWLTFGLAAMTAASWIAFVAAIESLK